ncbi:Mut7-C RNAse domain-containing protein [Motiliproteus sp. SC1-56]|uniref:Mut7-C RNAse domain-containing protein n=1 Tax=Motiliproteus sp. SC1-56 TaxID=2799565 RepID=UPI001A8CDCEF
MNHERPPREARFRFYGALNDFLPGQRRQGPAPYRFGGPVGLRDSIQAQGVPHPEVSLVLVDSHPRPPTFRLHGGERISVYPRLQHLLPDQADRWDTPLPSPRRFILDVHLGKLCRELRLLGFDCFWSNDLDDPVIIDLALAQGRIILTRDLGILKQARVSWGYFVRHTDPTDQVGEVADALGLGGQYRPLSRCINCNGLVAKVNRADVEKELPPGTRRSYDTFYRCDDCRQVYWRGAHYAGLMGKLRHIEK